MRIYRGRIVWQIFESWHLAGHHLWADRQIRAREPEGNFGPSEVPPHFFHFSVANQQVTWILSLHNW